MKRTRRWLSPFAVALLAGCERADPPPPVPPPAASTSPVAVTLPPLPERLRFRKEASVQGVGLPAGCRLELPTRAAPLPEGEIAFVTSPVDAKELLFLVKHGDEPGKAGLLPLDGATRARQFPWTDLEAPPALARADRGWLAAIAGPKGALESVMLWREGREAEPLAEGDGLAAWDARCTGNDCAVITSRVSKAAGPGASVFIGKAEAPAREWSRADMTGGDGDAAGPFGVLDVSGGVARVALASPGAIEIWSANAGKAERIHRLPIEHAAFEVFLADVPVVVAAGESIEEPCRKDGFPLRFERADGQKFGVTIPVPPDNLVTRPIEGGFIVAWVAPVSCRLTDRSMVHAVLLDRRGEPKSSAMAVADGTGFALSTRGSTVDIWLERGRTLTWATGVCHPGGPPASPPPAPSAPPAGSAFKSADK